jgi:WD40 repeat protein
MKISRLVALALVLVGGGVACTRSDDDKAHTQVALVNDDGDDGRNHDKPPYEDVAFLPDGNHLLSSSYIGVVLWDLRVGKAIRITDKPGGGQLVVSADGKWLLHGADGLSEISTGRHASGFPPVKEQIHGSCVVLGDGKRLVFFGGTRHEEHPTPNTLRGELQLWDIEKRERIHRFLAYNTGVISVALSSDGTLGLSVGVDYADFRAAVPKYTVKLWDLKKGKLIRDHEVQHKGQAAFSADDKWIYCMGRDFKAWNIETGALIHSFENFRMKAPPAAFSSDKRYYIARDGKAEWPPEPALMQSPPDPALRLWDMLTGKIVKVIPRVGERVPDKVRLSPDDKLAALAGKDALLQVWNLKEGNMVWNLSLPDETVLELRGRRGGLQ